MSGRIVVDASVALKWFFDDETDIVIARDLLARYDRRELELLVPTHWPLEVLNAFRTAIVMKRIDGARADSFAARFVKLAIPLADITPLAPDIYRAAVDLERTTYDAAYVVLAEKNGIEFITADRKLFNAIHAKKPFVRYLANYTAPSAPASMP